MDLVWLLTDNNNNPIVDGHTYTLLGIRRVTDGYFLDWNTMSFVSSGCIEPTTTYTEASNAYMPGFYVKAVTITAWDDGIYQAVSYYDDGNTILNKYEEFTVIDGEKYDDGSLGSIYSTLSALNNKAMDIPSGVILLQEYYNNIDSDGNGLIYGVDFYISTDRPKILDAIPRYGIPMSWAEYLASV